MRSKVDAIPNLEAAIYYTRLLSDRGTLSVCLREFVAFPRRCIALNFIIQKMRIGHLEAQSIEIYDILLDHMRRFEMLTQTAPSISIVSLQNCEEQFWWDALRCRNWPFLQHIVNDVVRNESISNIELLAVAILKGNGPRELVMRLVR